MRLGFIIATLSFMLARAVFCEEHPADSWILSGQSNSCGHAALPGPDPDPRVKMWDGKGYVQASEPLFGSNGSQVGPWLYAALDVVKAGVPVNISEWGISNHPITYWFEKEDAAGGSGWLTNYGSGLATAIKHSKDPGVFMWYQGESDAYNKMSEADYKSKLTELVKKVRTAANNPKMLVVIVQLARTATAEGDFMPIREAQRRVVIEDGNAILIPALGLETEDGKHLTKASYKELGQSVARALLKVRYGKKDVNWTGPVMDSAVLGADGKTVAVHFAEVKKLGGVKADDFGVIDADGRVKCVNAVPGNTAVMLTLERAVKLPAKAVYGLGQNPAATLVNEAGNRAPAVQLELKAGALPQDKETAAPNGAGTK